MHRNIVSLPPSPIPSSTVEFSLIKWFMLQISHTTTNNKQSNQASKRANKQTIYTIKAIWFRNIGHIIVLERSMALTDSTVLCCIMAFSVHTKRTNLFTHRWNWTKQWREKRPNGKLHWNVIVIPKTMQSNSLWESRFLQTVQMEWTHPLMDVVWKII